jgi:hypothetical protein
MYIILGLALMWVGWEISSKSYKRIVMLNALRAKMNNDEIPLDQAIEEFNDIQSKTRIF